MGNDFCILLLRMKTRMQAYRGGGRTAKEAHIGEKKRVENVALMVGYSTTLDIQAVL